MGDQSNTEHKPSLRAIDRELFETAKTWARASALCRCAVFGLGAAVVFLGVIPEAAPYVTALLVIASELLAWQASRVSGVAEALLRKLDWRDSFGWAISRAEVSDLLVRTSPRARRAASRLEMEEQYFASHEPSGARKAIENVQESAWFSKHVAETSGILYLLITLLALALAFVILVVSLETVKSFDILSNIGRVVTSALVLGLSLGLIRFVVGYFGFSQKAATVETEAERMRTAAHIDQWSAVKLMCEYQFARASAPVLPTLVWKIREDDLNQTWAAYRRDAVK